MKHDTKHDRNRNLVVQNHAKIMPLYNVLPSNFKPQPLGTSECSLPILRRYILYIGIYYDMDPEFAKHLMKHKF
jgi:hypothetical protein